MSQSKVSEFFSSRKKRDAHIHSAKRRKVEVADSSSLSDSVEKNLQNPNMTLNINDQQEILSNISSASCFKSELKQMQSQSFISKGLSDSMPSQVFQAEIKNSSSTNTISSKSVTRLRGKSKASPSPRATRSNRKVTSDQTKITDLLGKKHSSKDLSLQSSALGQDDVTVSASDSSNLHETEKMIIAEVTSTEDDHESFRVLMNTPRKRNLKPECETEPPKTRKCKTANRKGCLELQNPADGSKSAKKKLELGASKSDGPDSDSTKSGPVQETSLDEKSTSDVDVKETKEEVMDKPCLLRMASVVSGPEVPVSPLAATPEGSPRSPTPEQTDGSSQDGETQAPSVTPPSPKLKNLSEKLKALSKMNGKALKNRLKQSGKLDEIKQKVKDVGKALEDNKTVAADEVDGGDSAQQKEKLPAYQRFEHLAQAGKPSLVLPFSYKTLEGAFQAMDTVVSMLHNRSEMCTFSKLKTAVQNLTRKNFEEKTVGQIKTVAPEAYVFGQEKISCIKTNKKSFSLTVDADLSTEENKDEKVAKTPEGKPVFTASNLIRRKQKFHNSLIGLVMKHHKEFLSSLQPPMSVPEDKLTRWHPKFRLEEVPDVSPAVLPQPPDVRVYHSAQDVLQAQRGKLNPKVEEALAKVVAENKTATSPVVPKPDIVNKPAATSLSPSMKGIPPALLAKIRAKEAMKNELAMTRDPVEDSKTKMMGHLPEMVRILRSYFVTEKKPALPMEAVYKKLEDSYRSGISRKDVEEHMKLLTQLAPELCTIVKVKSGSYFKLDRNIDCHAVASKISKIAEGRK